MKSTFFLFTYKDFPNIGYTDRKVFKSKIFNSLYDKLGDNSLKWRVRKNPLFSFFCEKFFKKDFSVPNSKIKLMYLGYDSVIFFELDDFLDVKKVFRKVGDEKFVEEEFLGYSPSIFEKDEFRNQSRILIKFFKKHWLDLKKGAVQLHGDLVPSNICIKDSILTIFDSKNIYSESIIFDHLYFYCYTYKKIDERKGLEGNEKKELLKILHDIFLKTFSSEDKKFILEEVQNLKLKKNPFKKFPYYRMKFISLFEE